MICPKCGGPIGKETRQCPAQRELPVCMSCCNSCEYLLSNWRCLYRAKHPEESIEDEIMSLRRRAALKKKHAEHLWQCGKHYAAHAAEEEWRACIKRIAELEEER